MTNAYWQYYVRYTRDDGSWGSLVGGCDENTRDAALSYGFREASYYLVHNHYPSAEVTAEQLCRACHGAGTITIQRPRSTRTVTCKNCKGHAGSLQVIGPVPVQLHSNARDHIAPLAAR